MSDGEADFSFEDLLTFIAGADHLHPLGFPSQIFLRFYTQVCNFGTDKCQGDVLKVVSVGLSQSPQKLNKNKLHEGKK